MLPQPEGDSAGAAGLGDPQPDAAGVLAGELELLDGLDSAAGVAAGLPHPDAGGGLAGLED